MRGAGRTDGRGMGRQREWRQRDGEAVQCKKAGDAEEWGVRWMW